MFVPKGRRKAIVGQIRRQLGAVFHALAKQKECQIVEGHLMPDHAHICRNIRSRWVPEREERNRDCANVWQERNFTGEQFWARGYAVSRVGFELAQVKQYIRDQEEADGKGRF